MKSENYPGIKRKLIFNTIIFRFHVSFWGWFSCWTSNMWRISDGIRFPSYMGRSPDRSGPDCLLPELNTIPGVKVGLSPLLTHLVDDLFSHLARSERGWFGAWIGSICNLSWDRGSDGHCCWIFTLLLKVVHGPCRMSSKILMSFHSFMTFMVRCSYKYNISIIYHINVQIWTLRSLNLYMFPLQLWDFLGKKTSQVWISCLSGQCSA